ncbi:16S rRNA (guanine(966)-N(2))-methyltransferase RsmD [candidate division TA06 bacterium]|uniref:16S rRNA (Guanine(966)-N(2))-methyltransferase RsmD n=1 Tax=candidate division TA06 bacterium TaxID=2250710 RepID=A0A933MJG5_UNCT6|nr:16S rRNA (guanine(966)-N(2))-methyltransferase RsmD [candidate division TA06 bacterium]
MLKIIAGEYRGRILKTPAGKQVRPSSGLLRGVIFNVLGDMVAGKKVLDIYAGSGVLGIEALSRGAAEVTLVEADHKTSDLISQNMEMLKIQKRAKVIRHDALDFISSSGGQFDIVLADPPYQANISLQILDLAWKHGLLAPDGILVLQHHRAESIVSEAQGLVLWKCKKHGKSSVEFYTVNNEQ